MELTLVQPAARSFPARYTGRTVLALGAHPDDNELGIGGTLAALSRGGAHVVMAICSVPAHFETRCAEARAAAAILGCELPIPLARAAAGAAAQAGHRRVGLS